MKKLVWFAVAACAMFAMNQAAAEGKIYYSVESTVSVDGRVVMKPAAIALADNPVRTEIDGKNASSPSYRLEYTVTPVVGKEKSQATIHVSFFDLSMGNWVLRSQPSAVVRLGQEATIALPYHEGPASSRVTNFNITVSQVEENALLSRFNGKIPNPSLCPAEVSQGATGANHSASLGAKPNLLPACCDSNCGDGSGNTLHCCGAVSCSGCGTSCSP